MLSYKRDIFRNNGIKDIAQVLNPSTGNYIKKDNHTGLFVETKSDGRPFDGVRREAVGIRANPNIKKEIAIQAQAAVIHLKNTNKSK